MKPVLLFSYVFVSTPHLDATANEYYLFHGCNEKIVDIIGTQGFDERVSSLNGKTFLNLQWVIVLIQGMFGCGIYFAENSSKSDLYSHSKDCGQVGAVYQ